MTDDDDSFRSGGRALLADLQRSDDDAPLSALIVEAARQKDRLDQLHRVLAGNDHVWMELVDSRSGESLEIRIDSAAQEARQLATVFRQTLVEIQRRRGDDKPAGEADDLDGL